MNSTAASTVRAVSDSGSAWIAFSASSRASPKRSDARRSRARNTRAAIRFGFTSRAASRVSPARGLPSNRIVRAIASSASGCRGFDRSTSAIEVRAWELSYFSRNSSPSRIRGTGHEGSSATASS